MAEVKVYHESPLQAAMEPHTLNVAEMVRQAKEAANDPAFLSDLADSMAAFEAVDSEWWEPA